MKQKSTPRAGTAKWSVPREWEGETVFILGGGPSLKDFDAERLRGKGPIIATNEAGLTLAPWADVLYWADARWFRWNQDRLHLHTGPYKITRKTPKETTAFDIKVLSRSTKDLSDDPGQVAGYCSGGNAINLAYLFGTKRIVLLGFDMHGDNFHDQHRKSKDKSRYKSHFIPAMAKMAAPLKQAGVTVVNATPDSSLEVFPMTTLDEEIAEDSARLDRTATRLTTTAEEVKAEEAKEPVAPVKPPAKPSTALHDVPRQRVAEEIRNLSDGRVTVNHRKGATRRPTNWWRVQLCQRFASVRIVSTGDETVFDCRRHV